MTTSDLEKVARAIKASLISPNEADSSGEPANIVDGLFAIARAIDRLASATWSLGTGNAATQMGAIEYLASELRGTGETVASALQAIADRE
jgi:hypothetical protein